MVFRRRQLIRIPPQKVDRVHAPGCEKEAERREEGRVPAQERMHGRRGVWRAGEHRHEKPWHDEEGRDDRDRLAVSILHGKRLAPPGAVPLGVGEVLRGGRAEEEEAEDGPDSPRFRGERRRDKRPACNLEKAPPGNRDGHVRPDSEALCPPERRNGVDERREEAAEKEKKALVIGEGGGRPREEPGPRGHDDPPRGNEGEDVKHPRQPPRRRVGYLARDERPVGLVDAVDLEVGDLVQHVRGRVEERRAKRAQRDDPEKLRRHASRRIRVVDAAERADGTRKNAEERRQQRERAGEAYREAQVHAAPPRIARNAGAAAAPASVLMKFRTWPFETRQGAPDRPRRLSTTVPRAAASTTATAPRGGRRSDMTPAAARSAAAAKPASVPATETAPSVPGGT